MRRFAIVGLLFLATVFAQVRAVPTVTGVITASAYGGFSAASPGSFVEIYGFNLADTTRGWTSSDFNGPDAPTSLNGVMVSVGGIAAYISYVSPTQVNIQVPEGVPNGPANVIVSYQGLASAIVTQLTINSVEPGFYAPASSNINGKQYVGAFTANGAIVGIPGAPVAPSQTITIYGTGFGPVQGASVAGRTAPAQTMLTDTLSVTIGGSSATIQYAGLTPGLVGLYQFNIAVPAGAPDGDQAVEATLNGNALTLQTLYLNVVGN